LGVYTPGPHGYWLAEVTRQGVSTHVLPTEWTHSNEGLLAPRDLEVPLQAFQLGKQFGLLLSPEALLLFSNIQDDPIRIPIDHHFSGLGELAHPSHTADSYYQAVHCGYGRAGVVPVILSAPTGRGAGRHLALLEVDPSVGHARWVHTGSDGGPRTLDPTDYAGFDRSGMRETLSQMDPQVLFPIVSDCGWLDKHWLVYAAGHVKNLVRFGIPIGVLTRNLFDLSLLEPVFRPSEQSYGTICASLDRLIVSPLRKNGPHKGKQTIFTFGDAQEHAITLPRGCTKHQVLDYAAGNFWLAPQAMNYNRMPVTLSACRES
jgi:hypothetical protein